MANQTAQRSGVSPAGRAAIALPALFVGATCIAFAPIFVRLSEVGPSATAFWRVAFSIPLLALWMAREQRRADAPRRALGWRDYWRLSAAGVFFAADLALWHWSIKFTTVANATLFANFAPIFVTMAAFFLFRERFKPLFLLGLALAVGGATVLVGASVQLSTRHLIGDGLGIVTAVFYGAYIVAVGRLRSRYSTATIMTWTGVVCALVLATVALLSGESLAAATLSGWLVLLGLGLTSQVAGQSLIAFALAHLSAAFGSISLMLQPVVAAALAWALLAEGLGARQIVGGTVVLIGIFLANRGRDRGRTSG
ncbi:MAG: DMT family transporter [Sphingomonadales bacterium]